jgi:hypothetical protein
MGFAPVERGWWRIKGNERKKGKSEVRNLFSLKASVIEIIIEQEVCHGK